MHSSKTTTAVYHKAKRIIKQDKAYGIGGYKAALASFRFRGVFDTDSASLSIVERISKVLPATTSGQVVQKRKNDGEPVTPSCHKTVLII